MVEIINPKIGSDLNIMRTCHFKSVVSMGIYYVVHRCINQKILLNW